VNVHHAHERRRRARGVQVFIALLLGLLTAAFFRIQVLGSDTWELRSTSNRIRLLPLPAPRGIIYDRNGNILADNVPGYAITLLPGPLAEARGTLERMGAYVDMPEARIERLLSTLRRYGREVVIDADADFEVVSALEERRAEFRGVYIEMRPRRRYLLGQAAGHVLGYVGEITADELDSEAYAADRYREGMIVGQGGLEEQYESRLQGRQGLRYLEFDAHQRLVGDFGGARTDPGESGQDLYLNLDMELQAWIHSIFPDSMAGAVIALDPSDGGVLALYSAPSFDPNDFVGGISTELWASLNEDEGIPLYNRAVLGKYPPASTWKLATAAIGLDLGVVTPDEYMAVPCTGSFTFGARSYRCHLAEGHGFNNLTEAIGNSCDVYFYQLGLRITLDRLLRRATEIGFSQQCGIDLPQESQGTFPPDRAFWERTPFNYTPREGEVISLSIGQGPNAQTPLKMAQFYVALARDGTAPTPALAQGVDLGEGWSLELAPEHLEALLDGLRAVTAPGGTAHFGTSLEYWEVLGKTGTAEHALSQAGLAPSHAWFAGMAGPFGGPPEVVVVVIVEYGWTGSGVAAPIMAKTADFYLRKKYGIPIDSVQTYREHIMRGPVPAWYRDRYRTDGGTR
jgi:penicillin-binding protein 2